jgi:hypothetical protein
VRYKRPTKLPAPEYVDALMNWTQSILDDEAVFPNTIGASSRSPCSPALLMKGVGVSFPRSFKDTVRTIVRRLFRVYAHIYTNHFDQICALGIEGTFLLYLLSVALLIPLMYTSPSQYELSPLFPLHQRGMSHLGVGCKVLCITYGRTV